MRARYKEPPISIMNEERRLLCLCSGRIHRKLGEGEQERCSLGKLPLQASQESRVNGAFRAWIVRFYHLDVPCLTPVNTGT